MDIIGLAIDELKATTLSRVAMMYLMAKPENRANIASELGEIIADGKREFEGIGHKDPRINQALAELDEVFAKIARGENPFESQESKKLNSHIDLPSDKFMDTLKRQGEDIEELKTSILILCTILRDSDAEWSPGPLFRAQFPELCDKIDKIYGD